MRLSIHPFKIKFLSTSPIMLRHFNLILLGSLAGFLVHFYLIYSANYEYEEIKIVGIMLSLTTWIALSYIMYFTTIVIRRFLLKSEMIGLRLLLEIISFAVIAFFAVSLLYTMSESLFVVHNNENTWINGNYTKIGIVTFIICVIYAVILIALDSFQVYSENKLNFIAIQREHIDLQMAALKSHLSPHFLFNGLNTISSLIYTDKKKAEKYIRNLFSTYNYALTKYDNNTVTIQEELELVLAYLEMVNVRFGDSVNFINKIDQKYYQARVLPLSIQTLVENALKHNQADAHNLLTITLTLEGDKLTVHNNKNAKSNSSTSTGVGHENLKQRYKMISGKKISILDTHSEYAITIPLSL